MTDFQAMDAALVAQPIAAYQNPDGSFVLLRSSEHRKPTFQYAGNYTPVATPTDSIMIKGSNTRTLRIKRIILGGVATANGNMQAQLIRRSTQFTTQGTAAFNAVTPGGYDTTDAAATGVVSTIGTANLTAVGTAVGGPLRFGRLFLPTTATGTPNPLVWDYSRGQDKPLILRGVLDFIFINFNASALPGGGTVDFDIQIEEDQT